MREIRFTKKALKGFRKLPQKKRLATVTALEDIASDKKISHDIKKIQGENDQWRLRIGDYRIVYTIDLVVLEVVKIGPRGDIYK